MASSSGSSDAGDGKHSEFTSKFLLTDEQILSMGVNPHSVEAFRRAYYQQAFAVSTWAPQLGDRTFRTTELPLSVAEGRAILAKHYKRATAEDEAVLAELHHRIDEALRRDFAAGAFMKLDTRSPKDVPIDELMPRDEDQAGGAEKQDDDPAKKKYEIEFTHMLKSAIEAVPVGERTPNEMLKSYGKACAEFLCVKDADKALFLLTRSLRVAQDLSKFLEFPEKLFNSALILREWDDRVPDNQGGEYRGFVYDRKLNAVSQYASCLHFPEIVEHQEEIAKNIRGFFDKVVQLIPHESYIIDFIVFADGDIKVIELNPFHIGAGPALFTWREHRELFMHGPFEMRVCDKIPTEEDLDSILIPVWHRYIQQFRESPDSNSSWWCTLL